MFRLPARLDLPVDSVPDWVAVVYRDMKVIPMDWGMQMRESAKWMGYWDQHIRGTGHQAWDWAAEEAKNH